MTDALGKTTTFDRDPNGNVVSQTDVRGTTTFAYDAFNRVVEQVTPSGRRHKFRYDSEGNLIQRRVLRESVNGEPVTILSELRHYDLLGRLARQQTRDVSGATVESLAYTYDALGNPIRRTTSRGTQAYTYDALSRLTRVGYSTGDADIYTYDPAGNRTSKNGESYQYDALNRMTSAPGAKSYGFDAQGRTTTETTPEGTTTFIYDSLDRITGRAPEGQPAQSFAYDALGRLTTTTQSGLTRTNNYALSDSPILETTAITGSFSSSRARSLSYGPTGLLESRIGAARPSYPVADEHGSLIGEISDLGKATLAREYDPFGVELAGPPPADSADPSAPMAEESFDYLGAYARPGAFGSDLIHMGARVYNPEAGRFLSRDSLPGIEVEPQTQNPYAYGLNSPGHFYDLDGRNPIAVVVVGGIIVATGATVHVIAQTNPEWAEAEEELIDAAEDEIRDFANDVSSAVNKDNGQSPRGSGGGGKQRPSGSRSEVDLQAFSNAGKAPSAKKGGPQTRAGYVYQKHSSRGEFPKVGGKKLDATGQQLLDDILTSPGTRVRRISGGRFDGGTEFVRKDGVKAVFNRKGGLEYFGKRKN